MKINAKKIWQGFLAWGKEFIRKFLVGLKRNPQYIPLVSLFVSFVIYSLNLTDVSDATAKIQGQHMGLCAFAAMLLTILSMVCMLNAFPKRQKPNYPIIALMFVLFAIIIFADVFYILRINEALTRENNPLTITNNTAYIGVARQVAITHIITTAITAVLTALEPVLAKLLRKINTSIEVEDNGEIKAIDISEEE